MTEQLNKARTSPGERAELYGELCAAAGQCRKCRLCESRKSVVMGEGDINSPIMFVGEGPGEVEDDTGRPFVGPAGQLLSKILMAAGFDRQRLYITNIVKCRPPQNRVPAIEETIACQRWLEAQIAIINPRIIIALGNTPLKWFLHSTDGITKLRGRWLDWRGMDFMAMYHPSYLLRNQSRAKDSPKAQTWLDIQAVKRRYDEAISERQNV